MLHEEMTCLHATIVVPQHAHLAAQRLQCGPVGVSAGGRCKKGAEAIGIQRLGRAAVATQYALLQKVPPPPGKQPVIHVFPACPKTWDADFTLAARGGFLVTSSRHDGRIVG